MTDQEQKDYKLALLLADYWKAMYEFSRIDAQLKAERKLDISPASSLYGSHCKEIAKLERKWSQSNSRLVAADVAIRKMGGKP